MDLPITESQVNSLLVILSILGLCLYHDSRHRRRQAGQQAPVCVAEWVVEKTDGLVRENMGTYFAALCALRGRAFMALSACSSLMSLIGLYPPTSDHERRGRLGHSGVRPHHPLQAQGRPVGHYLKGFGEPVSDLCAA